MANIRKFYIFLGRPKPPPPPRKTSLDQKQQRDFSKDDSIYQVPVVRDHPLIINEQRKSSIEKLKPSEVISPNSNQENVDIVKETVSNHLSNGNLKESASSDSQSNSTNSRSVLKKHSTDIGNSVGNNKPKVVSANSKGTPPPLPTSKPRLTSTTSATNILPPQPLNKADSKATLQRPNQAKQRQSSHISDQQGNPNSVPSSPVRTPSKAIPPASYSPRASSNGVGSNSVNPSLSTAGVTGIGSPIRPKGPPVLPARSAPSNPTAPVVPPPIPTRDSLYANLGELSI